MLDCNKDSVWCPLCVYILWLSVFYLLLFSFILVCVFCSYPCEWGGVVDGKPHVKGLEDFAQAAVKDLWAALQKLFVEVRVSNEKR